MNRTDIKEFKRAVDAAYEMGVFVGDVEVKDGIKTLALERMYEEKNGDGWFIVTTITKYKTNDEEDHLTKDDEFLGREKFITPCPKGEVCGWYGKNYILIN